MSNENENLSLNLPEEIPVPPEEIEPTLPPEIRPRPKTWNTGCPDENPLSPNEIPLSPFNKAQENLNESKTIFEEFTKSLRVAEAITSNDFQAQATKKKEEIKTDFSSKIKSLSISNHSADNLVSELETFMNNLMTENSKAIADDLADKRKVALASKFATQFYRTKMGKVFGEKVFIPDFQELHRKITAKAIKECIDLGLTKRQEEMVLNAMVPLKGEYEEKNALLAPPESVAIGIDLGTTYSSVAVYRNNEITIIPNEFGKTVTPSYVGFSRNGSYVVGDVPKHSVDHDPANTSFDAKRLIGRTLGDPEVRTDMKIWPFKISNSNGGIIPKINIFGREYYPEEISARVLKHMKIIAEDFLGTKVENAVVTVPANFNNGQRRATKDAGEIAGLNILKIINEPTAAAIAYNLHRKDAPKRNVLVFDLGGGTMDVAILTIGSGEIQVRGVKGDTHLGGQDFDSELVNYCIQKFRQKYNVDLTSDSKALRRLRTECESAKCNLSSTTEVEVNVYGIYRSIWGSYDLHVKITRDEFEKLNESKFEKCMKVVLDALRDCRLTKESIEEIVLVGGSARIPKIQSMLSELFGGRTLTRMTNSDEAVAQGAAIQAAILNSKMEREGIRITNMITTEVTSFTIGKSNGVNNRLIKFIPKNTIIPCEYTHVTSTAEDGQTDIYFKVFEGEDVIAENNHLLGEFEISGIPAAKKGEERVMVTMAINLDGILQVTATIRSTGASCSLTISDLKGQLTKEQIAQLKLPE